MFCECLAVRAPSLASNKERKEWRRSREQHRFIAESGQPESCRRRGSRLTRAELRLNDVFGLKNVREICLPLLAARHLAPPPQGQAGAVRAAWRIWRSEPGWQDAWPSVNDEQRGKGAQLTARRWSARSGKEQFGGDSAEQGGIWRRRGGKTIEPPPFA